MYYLRLTVLWTHCLKYFSDTGRKLSIVSWFMFCVSDAAAARPSDCRCRAVYQLFAAVATSPPPPPTHISCKQHSTHMLFVAFRAVLPSPVPSASTTPISVSDVFTRLSFFLLFHLFVSCLDVDLFQERGFKVVTISGETSQFGWDYKLPIERHSNYV